MRIYLSLSPNNEIVPFNYPQNIVGAFHKWLGENELHDEISLYSLSWLQGGKMRRDRKGLDFPNGASLFISAPDPDLLAALIQGVFRGQDICWGMRVEEVTMKVTPDFGQRHRFLVQSPILIKRKQPTDKHYQFYYPSDPESNGFMTETLQLKLRKMNKSEDVQVRFDPNFRNPDIKKMTYRGIENKGALCPVIVEGNPEAVAFAWEVGIGNSTGIGFGALK